MGWAIGSDQSAEGVRTGWEGFWLFWAASLVTIYINTMRSSDDYPGGSLAMAVFVHYQHQHHAVFRQLASASCGLEDAPPGSPSLQDR
ncbi:hypothetical protein C8R42DRAFT_678197 [Lentinula raphanica]|nr:hypothetical protein C8R42DRAFT_678197 [Lentinula raphanica]